MIIEVKSLLLILGILAFCLVLKLIWELILLTQKARQSLTALDKTLETYQDLASKTSDTLEEVDVLLGDTQEVAEDYRLLKGEFSALGTKAGEVASQVLSHFFK